jgi:hypothetical protein
LHTTSNTNISQEKGSDIPTYIPLKKYIDENHAEEISQDFTDRLKTLEDNSDMLKLPIGCLQLIRATELLLHTEDEEDLDGRNL